MKLKILSISSSWASFDKKFNVIKNLLETGPENEHFLDYGLTPTLTRPMDQQIQSSWVFSNQECYAD